MSHVHEVEDFKVLHYREEDKMDQQAHGKLLRRYSRHWIRRCYVRVVHWPIGNFPLAKWIEPIFSVPHYPHRSLMPNRCRYRQSSPLFTLLPPPLTSLYRCRVTKVDILQKKPILDRHTH